MKNKLYIILVMCALMVSFAGCKVEDSDVRVDNRGYYMFTSWNVGFADLTEQFSDIAFRFNAWLVAPDSLRPLVRDLYFPDFSILQNTETSWKLVQNGTTEYVVETDGHSLSTTNAHWLLTKCQSFIDYCGEGFWDINVWYNHTSFSDDNIRMEITCVQPYQWNIVVNPQEQYGKTETYANLTLSVPSHEMPSILNNLSYEITGYGRFSFEDDDCYIRNKKEDNTPAYMDFQIQEPLVSEEKHPRHWSSGAVCMRAWCQDGRERQQTAYLSVDKKEYHAVFYENDDPRGSAVDVTYIY